jgi:hypothetical protein
MLSREILEAEVDPYLQHVFLDNADRSFNNMPIIHYAADGFEKPGVTLLFGGNHGDKHCPISCTVNLSSPQVRKQKKELG